MRDIAAEATDGNIMVALGKRSVVDADVQHRRWRRRRAREGTDQAENLAHLRRMELDNMPPSISDLDKFTQPLRRVLGLTQAHVSRLRWRVVAVA